MRIINFSKVVSVHSGSFTFFNFFGLHKKLILLTGCYIILLSQGYSQNSGLPFSANLSIGPSFPVGKFNETTFDSSSVPNAINPGPSITVLFAYHFKQSFFGVEILGGSQGNSVNIQAIARDVSGGLSGASFVAVKSDNWHIWKVLAGPTFEIPLTKDGKTSFECDALGGILKTSVPAHEIGVNIFNPPTNFFVSLGKNPLPTTFCYQADAGIKYHFTKSWSISGTLGFTHARPAQSFTIYLDPPYFQEPVHMSQAYPISTINLLVGVGYSF